jgi:hypothetical protein
MGPSLILRGGKDMDMMIESVGVWIKTGKVWTHLHTGAQRHSPPNFAFHAMLKSKPGSKKLKACDIQGIFVLKNLSEFPSYNQPIYSVLIGTEEECAPYILDDVVIKALNSWSLIDNPEEIENA